MHFRKFSLFFLFLLFNESKQEICHVLPTMMPTTTSRRLFAAAFLATASLAVGLPAFAEPAPAREWVSPPPGNAQTGAALYQQHCTACHNIDSNKIGPAHRGVMGRKVGSLTGYKYSTELAASRLRWTPQTLNKWLSDPEELVSGQRMGFLIESEQERADLIAYLATLK